jgi:hypothetical protein
MTAESRIRFAQIFMALAVVVATVAVVAGDWLTAAGMGLMALAQVGVWRQARHADRSGLRVNEPQSGNRFFKSAAFPILVMVVVAFVVQHLIGS